MSQLSIVTGGGGFVGRHLVASLLERGDRVRILDVAEPAASDAEFVRTDITDPASVLSATRGADVVFHNASLVHTKQNKADVVWAVNHESTQHVIDACQRHGVPKLVYVSSVSVVYEGEDIENGDESLPYATKNLAPYAQGATSATAQKRETRTVGGACRRGPIRST